MKNTKEIKNTQVIDTQELNAKEVNKKTYNDGFDMKSNGGEPAPLSREARQRRIAFIQKERRRKAKKQRIAAALITLSVTAAGIASFCIFGIPMINKSATDAPAAATTAQKASTKKAATKTQPATSAQTNDNTAYVDTNGYTESKETYNYVDTNTNNNDTNTNNNNDTNTNNNSTNNNTSYNTNSNTTTDDKNVNVVQPYDGSDTSKGGNGSIGDSKTNPIDNPNAVKANTENKVNTNNNTNTNTNNDDVNVVQPFEG